MKRLLLWLLGLGLVAITALSGTLLYSSYHFKQKLELASNEFLEKYSKTLQDGISLSYTPFTCSGLVYIQCSSPQVKIKTQGFTMVVNNPTTELKSLDSKSLKFNSTAQFNIEDVANNLQVYADLFSPIALDSTITFTKTSDTQYSNDTQITLDSQYLTQTLQFQWDKATSNLKKQNFWSYLIDQEMRDAEKVQFQNIKLTTQSKGFSDALFHAVSSQGAYKGLDKKGFDTLVSVIFGLSFQSLYNDPDSQPIAKALIQMQHFITGKTNAIHISLEKTSQEELFINASTLEDLSNIDLLKDFLKHYQFQVN